MEFLKNILQYIIVPIHKEGYPFIFVFAVVALILALVNCVLGGIGVIATLWCVYFFRDPDRVTPLKEGLIVSPADGLVSKITIAQLPKELESLEEYGINEGKRTRISIFLSVFDVHVTRAPIGGVITKAYYYPGAFFNATLDKASDENERNMIAIKTDTGTTVACVQIAGLIARRIICDVREDDQLKTGQRFGIIRFGSRVDVYLPAGVNPLVIEGQRAIGGETVLADMNSREEPRIGTKR